MPNRSPGTLLQLGKGGLRRRAQLQHQMQPQLLQQRQQQLLLLPRRPPGAVQVQQDQARAASP